jgi:hypothetical protein
VFGHSDSGAGHGLPSLKVGRSGSDRISPRSASEAMAVPGAPRLAAQAGSRPHAPASSSTPRIASQSQSNRPGPHLGKNPASGYPGVPLTPAQTLVRYGGVSALTEYEQSEVLNFHHVYYVGAGANKHHTRPNHRVLCHYMLMMQYPMLWPRRNLLLLRSICVCVLMPTTGHTTARFWLPASTFCS